MNSKLPLILCMAVVLVTALPSCLVGNFGPGLVGEGPTVKSKPEISEFNEIKASSSFDVSLAMGESEYIEVEVNENLLQYIDVYTKANILFITLKPNTNIKRGTLKARVVARNLNKIMLSGASDLYLLSDLKSEKLDVSLSGSSDFKTENKLIVDDLFLDLSGASDVKCNIQSVNVRVSCSGSSDIELLGGYSQRFNANVSGSSEIKAENFVTDYFKFKASGSSDAIITVNKELDIAASGASSVRYKGNGSVVNSRASGASSIKRIE